MFTTGLGLCVISLMVAITPVASAQMQHVNILVNYEKDPSRNYSVSLELGQEYTISQKYTWQNTLGRLDVTSYTIDEGPDVTIPRHSDGNFTINIPTDKDHTVTFRTIQQFEITSTYDGITFSPPSPTGDNWFDDGSGVQFVVPYVIQSDNQSRQQLAGWSEGNSDVTIIPRQDAGLFRSHVIQVTEKHDLSPQYKNQYYVNVISNFGKPLGTGWYDSGTIANISVIPGDDSILHHVFLGWQGQVIGDASQYSAEILVDSPKVMVANWSVDYTDISIIAIIAIAVLVIITIYKKRRNPAKI
ncbi:exported hypothetical protein [Nitrosotalea sinensis]|uniref:Uncharacterized protein n=1 Tax=Nitrosotalea sinensis TaxID=1499975 RepID=A0A2H1EI10_9ARCH|nr:hypothetical protein [Candidatus Nitrosotalea sinensis]SHO45780.1 exported hypothetical protein [Candidatus Nitrosotalea sinensis]